MVSLASTRAGHPPLNRKCSRFPRVGVMVLQREQKPSLLELSQCLVRASTLALPDKYRACTTALETWYGELPQEEYKGWEMERDM